MGPAVNGGQDLPTAAELAHGRSCALVTQAKADASEGTPNVAHDGSPLPGVTAPDISLGFRGIPRSARPPLTATQRRILECTYALPEAGVAPIAGAGGIRDCETAERFHSLMHGELDFIVPAAASRRSVWWLQAVGAPHLYLQFPGMDHEFWIRRGAEHMEKVFLFFATVSRANNVGFITDGMLAAEN